MTHAQRLYELNMNEGSFTGQEAFRIRRIPWEFQSGQEREKYRKEMHTCGKVTGREKCIALHLRRVMGKPHAAAPCPFRTQCGFLLYLTFSPPIHNLHCYGSPASDHVSVFLLVSSMLFDTLVELTKRHRKRLKQWVTFYLILPSGFTLALHSFTYLKSSQTYGNSASGPEGVTGSRLKFSGQKQLCNWLTAPFPLWRINSEGGDGKQRWAMLPVQALCMGATVE